MSPAFNLDGYLDRIGYGGPTSPTYETLAGLVAAHTAHVPFENFDVLLGRGITLDVEALEDKIVRRRRGGYCFEQATLFAAALEALGFALSRHTARVVMGLPRERAPRTHMLLVVRFEAAPFADDRSIAVAEHRRAREFVVDVGLGGLVPRIPIALARNAHARFGHDVHTLVRDGRFWTMHGCTVGRESDCWTTTLDLDQPVDFEVGNHYTATHPASGFVNRLMLRAFTPDGRITVSNRDATIVRGTATTSHELEDRRALRRLVADHFGFDLPEIESLRVPSVSDWR